MSKQSEAKVAHGHVVKPVWPVCGNFQHFTLEMVTSGSGIWVYTEEKRKTCTLGGFATGKTATRKKHEWKKADGGE